MDSLRYAQPVFPTLLLFTVLFSLLAFRRRSRRWAAAALVSGLALFLWSWPPVHYALALPFELPFTSLPGEGEKVDAIVVLSGAVRGRHALNPVALPGYDTYVRCAHAAWVYRNRYQVPIVATGGGAPGETAADVSARLLMALGVPADHVLLERRSRSTWENALYAAEILRERGARRVVVVTQAYHMWRSAAVFRKLGFEVVPAACDFATAFGPFHELVPDGTTIRRNELLLHEFLGYIWYWIRGRV